jgi:hypothetical protein
MPVGDPNAAAQKRAEQGAILDLLKDDLARLRGRVSTEEYPKIDAHLTGLAALEQRLTAMPPAVACTAPAMPAAAATQNQNAAYPTEVNAMLDLVLHAFACDLTRVASVQLSHGFSGVIHTWLGQNTAHHTMSHDATVDRRPELQAIDKWYATQFASFLMKMDAIDEGNGTLLDNTLVVWGRELGTTSHAMQPWPVVMIGGAQGALRTGRFLDVSNQPHAQLLVSVQQMMGLDVSTIGNIDTNSGPLAKLA